MSFADYAKKKYGGQNTNEQSFSSYAQGKYGTERGDVYAREQKQKEQISNALNSFVDRYKSRREQEDAALEAAKAAEKEKKRQEELVKYGVKSAGSAAGSVSAIASAAEALARRLNPQRSTPENAARVMENKRKAASSAIQPIAMPSDDTQSARHVINSRTTLADKAAEYRGNLLKSMSTRLDMSGKPLIAEAYDEPAETTAGTAAQGPRTVDLDNLLARGAQANGNRLQKEADKRLSGASKGALRAAEKVGSAVPGIDNAEYLNAKKAYDDYVAKYDRVQGPFLDENGNLITTDDIRAQKAALKAAMDAANDKQRQELAKQYKWLANRPDFKRNLQNGYTQEDQVLESATDGARFKSDEAQLIYNMTGAERRILTYLRNTQGEDAAKDYIAVLKPDLEQRAHDAVAERMTELTEKDPVTMSVVSALANVDNTIRGGAYTLRSAAAKLAGIDGYEMDPNDLSYIGGTARNAIRENVGERLNKYFAGNEGVRNYLSSIGRNLGVKELSSGNAPRFVYDTIMSGVVDSTLSGVIGGAFGSTAVGAALVSGSALVDTARDVKMQGGSDERALALGAVAGYLEYVTEKMGFDRLADMITNGGKGGIRAVLSNMASEYAEEASSEIGNYLAEWAADALDDVDMSTFRQTRQAYIDQGLSEEEATRRTWKDFALQVNEAGMGGALGGAIMGGGSQVVGRVFNAVAQHEYNDAVDRAAEAGDAAAKAYRFNDNGLLRRGDYDSAFNTIWNGAADGLTLEQIEQAAPDIVGTLEEAQKQGIFDAATNAAQTAETVQTADAAQSSETEAPAMQRPEIRTVQFDDEGNRTESTVAEQTTAETTEQAQTEQTQNETETQPAREHALEQHETTAETAAEQPVNRDQVKGEERVDRTEETRQRGAEAVSERVSEENREEIEAYVTDQTKTAKGGVKRSYTAQKLNRQQKGQIRILDELGRHYGVEIEVVDSIEGGKANAVYEGSNRIKVALDAANQAYVQVGTHELVHYLKNRDEAGYRVVEKMVVDELSKAEGFSLEDAITERRAEYAAQDVMIDDSAAMEEIVAEAIPSIWGDERAVKAFVSQNRSLAQKVRDFIVDFVDRLKQYAVDYAVDQDRTEILALQSREQDAAGTLEQIARTFDLALESAREKVQSGDGAAQTEYTDGQRVNLPDGVKYSIKSFREQIQDVLDGKFPRNDYVYVMDTPEVLQKLGLKALPMLMTQRHARTTTLTGIGHRGENYHGLGLDLMEQLPNAITNPVMVIKSYNYDKRITVITQLVDGNGDSVIAAVEVNGYGTWENVRIDSNTVASVYGKEHISGTIRRAIENDEVMYIDKNKSASFAQSVGVQFPESLSNGDSYVHSVSDLMPAVKGENAENHAEDAQDTANSEQTQAETPESEPKQENGEQKFSLKKNIEQVKDLIAVHNLKYSALESALDLGGMPSPSIGVVKAEQGHTDYGPMSFVFDRNSIDPKLDKRNKAYGSDAWTPTAPMIEYEANPKTISRLRSLYNKVRSQYGDAVAQPLMSAGGNLESLLSYHNGVDGIINEKLSDSAMRRAYVAAIGGDATSEKKTTTEGGVSAERADKYRRTLQLFDGDVDKMMRTPINQIMDMPGIGDIWSSFVTRAADRLSGVIAKTADFARGKLDARTVEVDDAAATNAKINRQIDEGKYKAWLNELFGDAVGNVGIYNGKERYTPSGSRRNFKQLHNPVTLENIVKAMNTVQDARGEGAGTGATAIQSLASPMYRSINEIKADSGRLGKVSEAEYAERIKAVDAKLDDVARLIREENAGGYAGGDVIDGALKDGAAGKHTMSAVKKAFGEYGLTLTDSTAKQVLDIYEEAGHLPTGYFEVKPQRAVGFDEVRAAIVPDDMPAELLNRLKEKVSNVIVYPAGNDAARIAAMNGLTELKFSLKNESADKVDVDQTLRAGNSSMAGQTETQEHTRHEPVDVTDKMRQWADRRAGQIIREYRSTVDADSVRTDVANLVSELAEHGASSDALNATVNMAKGIIEKSRRLDNTLRDQYKDLRRSMRETAITLTDEQKQEAANITGSYGRYRQSLMGSLKLVNEGGTPLDTMWTEWSGQYPELFTPGMNEGDQVARLAEIKTMFEPKYVNEYGEHLDAAAADLGMSLYAEALKQVGDAARAQQVTQNLNGMRSRYSEALRQALWKVKGDQVARFKVIANELQAARTAGDRARQDEIMKAYRADMKRAGMQQVEAEARSAYRAQFEDAAAWRKAHERTVKYARTLRQELAKPTKQKHIPAGLEKPVLDVLGSIDMSTTGRETQGTRQWKQSLESISKWLDEQDRLQTNALDESQSATEGHEGVWMAICGRTLQDLRAAIKTVSGTSGRVNQMSLQEMNALSNAMSIINHSINSINQTWTLSRTESMNQLGDRSVSEMQKKRTNRAQDSKIPLVRELDTLLNVDQLDAVSFFERLGDVGGNVAESLTAGQSKAYERIREAANAADEIFAVDGVENEHQRRELIRGWRNEQHTFTLTRGTTVQDVTMSGTQLMELYALSKREQARKHILSGGIRIAGQDGQMGDVYNYQVTQEQLDRMVGELTPAQKRVVDRMQAYLSGDVADWGNEVTMEMYLYKAFNEKNYWPIRSDSDYKRTKEQDGSVMYNALLNASWTKALVDRPSNPITIGDAIETFAGHVSDMASYSGLAMPVDDMLKWYNYQSRDENGRADYNGSVKKEIRRTIGSVGTQYIQRLMDDLNGMSRRSYENDLIGKAISNYKRAAIMAKVRVVIQQPTAILRASAVMNPKYFSGVFRGVGRNTIAEMQEHSGLAWWKSNGNYEIGTGASMKSMIIGMQDSARETVSEKLGAPAGMADDLGWACIWQAVKRETEAEHPNIEVGGEAYWNIVRNRFEDVCLRTQVVDTVLTRSQLMRSKSQLMKSVTAFMSEPTKNYNLIRNAVSAVYNAQTPEARKAAVGTLVRSAAAIAAAQALNAVVTAAHDMLKYYDPDDEDEDGKEITRIDMFADNWFSDMTDGINPLANIPIIKDVYALMMGEDVERMDLSAISDVVDAMKKLDNYLRGDNTRGLSAWGAVRPLLKAVGDMAGLPASGLIADTELLLNIVSPGVTRSMQRESNTSEAYTMIYQAMAAGDTKKAAGLRAKLKGGAFGKTPKSDKEIDAGIRDVLAIEDDRIRRCFEMKQQGGSTKELAALQKEIAADGFTMEQVVGAVNNYARLVGRTVRDNYKAAYLVKDEKQMKLYADQAKSLGYDDDDIAGWVAEKDLDEQLSGEMYTKDDMMSYIRKGTDGDIKDVVDYRVSVSSAEDPEQSVRNAIASEFKDEYLELIGSGRTGDAQKLKNRLMTAGLSEKTIDGWVYTNDDLKAYLLDGQGTKKQAQDILDYKVRTSGAKKPEDSAVNALKSYRDEYIELARGNRKKAEAMAKRLIDLGLSENLIDTWNDAAEEEEE